MARYIKANPKVVSFLNLEKVRNKVRDGNYLLWQSDILKFGSLTDMTQILSQIGAISLMPHEARQEQDGIVLRELPQATDERFIMSEGDNIGANSSESEGDTIMLSDKEVTDYE